MEGFLKSFLEFIVRWEPFAPDLSRSCENPEFRAVQQAVYAELGIVSTIAFVTSGSIMILRWKKLWPLPDVAGLKRMVGRESGRSFDDDEDTITRSTQTLSQTSLMLADSPTSMYWKAKRIEARRLSKALSEIIYKARTDPKKKKKPSEVPETGKHRKRKYRSQRAMNYTASILTEAEAANLKHLKEQSDNVKARLLLALQEKRQLKKSISEGEKEFVTFDNDVKEAWIQWQLTEKQLKDIIEEAKMLKQKVKKLEAGEPFDGSTSDILESLTIC
ncbi:hypothetical protein LSAT2_000069 [Lamellibrachia satsuma]|nr:hypothetical protein LSAT2_000069 [Lamellibrachia satsuma]